MLGSMDDRVRKSYGARADEYTALLGSVEQLSALDRERILSWARACRGPLLDLGCGPGHWTALLHDEGSEVRGVDIVPEFVELARRRFPGIPSTSATPPRSTLTMTPMPACSPGTLSSTPPLASFRPASPRSGGSSPPAVGCS
ncbi:hypothetical protein GCM10027033_30140 [Leucobacter ruminantium]